MERGRSAGQEDADKKNTKGNEVAAGHLLALQLLSHGVFRCLATLRNRSGN